jgi:LEA14-like dessication related protein
MKQCLALLICLWLIGCSTLGLQKPQVSLVDIHPAASTLLEQNFDVTLRLQNPNTLPLSASGLSFDLNVAGNRLASGLSNQAIAVPALGEAEITVRVHTSTLSWLKQLGKAVNGSGKLDYQLQGRLEGLQGVASLPFSSSGEWKLP